MLCFAHRALMPNASLLRSLMSGSRTRFKPAKPASFSLVRHKRHVFPVPALIPLAECQRQRDAPKSRNFNGSTKAVGGRTLHKLHHVVLRARIRRLRAHVSTRDALDRRERGPREFKKPSWQRVRRHAVAIRDRSFRDQPSIVACRVILAKPH